MHHIMQKVITNLDIPYEHFVSFLRTTNGVVAGSAALWASMEDEGNSPTWQPNDVDIWIPVPCLTKTLNTSLHDKYDPILTKSSGIREVARIFFERFGYHDIQQKEGQEARKRWQETYMSDKQMSDIIHRITYLEKGDKKIQIILTCDVPVQSILNDFDLSVCKVAWTSEQEYVQDAYGKFRTDQVIIKKGVVLTNRLLGRIQKYMERGFKVVIDDK